MLILGMGVLGDLNTPATSQESLGLAFWRIVVSAGILAMVMSVVNIVKPQEFHFLRPRCWGHCTSCTSLRGGSASESRHTSKFPAIIQARYKTRGLTSNIYSFAFTSEEAGLHTEYDSVSTEDIPANELERCSVIQILSGLGGCDHSRPVSSSSHVLFAGLGLTIFCDERGV